MFQIPEELNKILIEKRYHWNSAIMQKQYKWTIKYATGNCVERNDQPFDEERQF